MKANQLVKQLGTCSKIINIIFGKVGLYLLFFRTIITSFVLLRETLCLLCGKNKVIKIKYENTKKGGR